MGGVGPQAPSSKLQATLTMDLGYNRMNIEKRGKYGSKTNRRVRRKINEPINENSRCNRREYCE